MARFDVQMGRYLFVVMDGVEYRVYYEETGRGIPILLQHTAGSDGRQWRHFLADEVLQRDFRMIAYDLPYHGKSVPPSEVEWWRTEYKLTKNFLMDFVVTMAHELALERPIYMGSSIGGNLATDLALHYPREFRAIIGLEAGIKTPGGWDDQWAHPQVHNEYKASVMYGLMAPQSPEKWRRETAWCYSQGAPRVFKGDLWYYSVEHDLSETAEQIDTSITPLYLLTGEYDWASTPEMSEELSRRIKGSNYQTMKGLGHFPMSEDPETFRRYIAPILEEIRRR
jgi:pimeloyl-ACP methyl ester carboxylesterase